MSILNTKKNQKDPEQLDLLMRSIKAFRSTGTVTSIDLAHLEKKRTETELASHLVTPFLGIHSEAFSVGEIPCEHVIPEYPHNKRTVILYCHGGGYTCGGLGYAGILAGKLVHFTGFEVYDFAYRLAPEHPYPAAIEDAVSVWNHLMALGYGARDVIVVGDSAGGNLALELCLELKKADRILPGALILLSPWTDMRATSSSYKNYAEKDPILNYEYVCSVRDAYLNGDTDYEKPEYSPLFADLTGFPPTLIQVGSNEILRRDSEKLEQEMRRQGCLVKIELFSGGYHVFQQLPTSRATQAMEQIHLFLEGLKF